MKQFFSIAFFAAALLALPACGGKKATPVVAEEPKTEETTEATRSVNKEAFAVDSEADETSNASDEESNSEESEKETLSAE